MILSQSVAEFAELASSWVDGELGEEFVTYALDDMEENGANVFESLVDFVELNEYRWKKVIYELNARQNAKELRNISLEYEE